MKIIKLHKIAFNTTTEIFVNPTQVGNFERGNSSTWLCLRNGYYCDVGETPEEILQLINDAEMADFKLKCDSCGKEFSSNNEVYCLSCYNELLDMVASLEEEIRILEGEK